MLAQRLLALRTCRHRCQGLAQLGPVQGFAADASQKSLDEEFTVTVNPFKGHRLEPPGRGGENKWQGAYGDVQGLFT